MEGQKLSRQELNLIGTPEKTIPSYNKTNIAISLIVDALLIAFSTLIAYILEKFIEYFLIKSSLDNLTISVLQTISSITTIISFSMFAIVDIIKLLVRSIKEVKNILKDFTEKDCK